MPFQQRFIARHISSCLRSTRKVNGVVGQWRRNGAVALASHNGHSLKPISATVAFARHNSNHIAGLLHIPLHRGISFDNVRREKEEVKEETMIEFEHPTKVENESILAALEEGDMEKVEKSMEFLKEQGYFATPIVYQKLIAHYTRTKQTNKIMECFNDLDQRYNANLLNYSQVLSYLSDIRSFTMANRLLKRARESVTGEEDKEERSSLLNVEVKLKLKQKHTLQSILNLLEPELEKGSNESVVQSMTFNQIINHYALLGDIETAERMLDMMRLHGFSVDEYSLNPLLLAYSKVDRPEDVVRLWNSYPDENILPNVPSFNIMIRHYAKQNDVEEVEMLRREMEEYGLRPQARTLKLMLDMYMENNNMEKAHAILAEADELGISSTSREGAELLNSLLYHLARSGDTEQIRSVIDSIVEGGGKLTTEMCNHVIQSYAKKRDHEGVSRMWREMQPSPEKPGIKPNKRTFHILMDYFAVNGSPELVRKTMQEMRKYQEEPGIITYNLLLKAYVVVKDEENLIRAFNEILESPVRPITSSYNLMISYYKSQGQFDKSEMWFEKMQEKGVKPCSRTIELMKGVENRDRGRRKNYQASRNAQRQKNRQSNFVVEDVME